MPSVSFLNHKEIIQRNKFNTFERVKEESYELKENKNTEKRINEILMYQ